MEKQVRFKTFKQIEDAIGILPIKLLVDRHIDFSQCIDSVKVWNDPYSDECRLSLNDERLSEHFFKVSTYITNGEDLLYYMCKWYQLMQDRFDMSIGRGDIQKFYRDVYLATNKAFEVIYRKLKRTMEEGELNYIINNILGYLPPPLTGPITPPQNQWSPCIPWKESDVLPETDKIAQIFAEQETNQDLAQETNQDFTPKGDYILNIDSFETIFLHTCKEKGYISIDSTENKLKINLGKEGQKPFAYLCFALTKGNVFKPYIDSKGNTGVPWTEIRKDFYTDDFKMDGLSKALGTLKSQGTLQEKEKIDEILRANNIRTDYLDEFSKKEN